MIEPTQIIYLDNNATTQLDPAVVEEMQPFLTKYYGNPSSGYGFAAQVRDAIELARERVANLVGCTGAEIIFTSGGTEANNTALNAALQLDPKRRHIITTVVEHSAVRRTCQVLAQRGCEVTFLEVNHDGEIDLAELEHAITSSTAIVSIMWANNETGVLLPVEKAAEIAREKRVLFHTDAVQALTKVPVELRESPINFLSLAAHKIYGPKGIGALFVNRRTAFRPLLFGGSHENNRRAGTENVAGIVGLGKAAELAATHIREEQAQIRTLRDRFEKGLLAAVSDTHVNGAGAERICGTSSVSFAGIESDAALIMLDRHSICCSAGSACRTGSPEASHVLRAMKLDDHYLRGTLRFSFGRFNSESEVDRALEIVPRVVQQLRQMSGYRSGDIRRAPASESNLSFSDRA